MATSSSFPTVRHRGIGSGYRPLSSNDSIQLELSQPIEFSKSVFSLDKEIFKTYLKENIIVRLRSQLTRSVAFSLLTSLIQEQRFFQSKIDELTVQERACFRVNCSTLSYKSGSIESAIVTFDNDEHRNFFETCLREYASELGETKGTLVSLLGFVFSSVRPKA